MAYEFHRMIHLEPSSGGVDLRGGSLTLMGETSALIEFGGIHVLANLSLGQRPARDLAWRPLPGEVGPRPNDTHAPVDVPALDAVVQLEMPDQQFDAFAERKLDPCLPIVTFPAAVGVLEGRSLEAVYSLSTWQWIVLRKGDASITLTSLPVCDVDAGDCTVPAMGCMVELRSRPDQTPYRIYLSGPARLTPQVEEISYRYPRIDLGVVTLTSTTMLGVMLAIDIAAGLELTQAIRLDRVIPVHRLDHVFDWSRRDFERAMARHGDPDSTMSLEIGQPFWFKVDGALVDRSPDTTRPLFSPASSFAGIPSTMARSR